MATKLLPGGAGVGGVQFNDGTIQYTANPTPTVTWANVTGRSAAEGWKTFYGMWAPGRNNGTKGNCGVFPLAYREQHFVFADGAGQTFDIYYYNLNCTDCNCNCSDCA
jgi:hypothetical protein